MSFSDVIDQQGAVELLKRELKTGRVSHAYLFLGKEGVGKKTLAMEFARAINCQQLETDACDSCLNCRRIAHHNHPDVQLLGIEEDSSSLKIDQIRELQKNIAYKPYESTRKVYIIDDADKMTTQAANSLLKTLEEPPEYAVLVLLAEEESRLLPTVLSRCQQVQLKNISREKIRDFLKKQGLEPQQRELLSGLARGSLGRAVSLSQDEEFLKQRSQVLDFVGQLPGTQSHKIFDEAGQLVKFMRADLPVFDLLSSWYRDIMIYKQGNQDSLINRDYIEDISRQAGTYDREEVLSIIELLNRYAGYLEQNVNKRFTLQTILLKIRSKRM